MTEMLRRFLRQRFGSVGTVLALLLLALMASVPLNAGQGFGSTDTLAVLVLGAGSVSRDATSGALQMILSRPIRRTAYLAGRYAGILVSLAAFLLGAVAIAAAVHALLGRLSTEAGRPEFPAEAAALGAGHAFLAGALLAAALLFFSTFLRGFGDVLAVVLFTILFMSMQSLGRMLNAPVLAGFGRVASENVAPSVAWDQVFHGQSVFGEPTGRYVLALVGYWTLAAAIFCRRQFSYGQD